MRKIHLIFQEGQFGFDQEDGPLHASESAG